MTDIRCPMCGKQNSAESQVCKFCQARLKPLIVSSNTSDDADTPDWLSNLRPQGDASFETFADSDQASSSEADGWFDRLTGAVEPASNPFSSVAEETSEPEKAGDPDWLQRIQARKKVEEASGSGLGPFDLPSEAPSRSSDAPEWMSELSGLSSESSNEATPSWMQETGPALDENAPDWLQELKPEASRSKAAEAPDWLQGLSAGSTTPEPESRQPAPDWLAAPTPFGQAASFPDGDSQAGQAPDWLSDVGTEPPASQPTPSVPAFVMSDDDLASFAPSDQDAGAFGSTNQSDVTALIAQMDVDAPREPQASPFASGETELPSDLAPAQLPSWLEAMRPIGSSAPNAMFRDEADTHVESAGPLAGLRGVLPAEAEITRIRKPPLYSVRVQVNEEDQARVALLEELLSQEGRPKPITVRNVSSSQALLRIAVAVVMMVVAALSFWYGGKMAELPAPGSIPDVESLRNQIEALPSGIPVLVAFEYEPGLMGEMEAAAAPAIAHLLQKQVPLVLVSTHPNGPMLAEHLLRREIDALNDASDAPLIPYTTTIFANLGYIPGGVSGLRAFADAPAKLLPRTLEGKPGWKAVAGTTEAQIDAFAMVLVISDNADTARDWLEQVEPKLSNHPMTMVLSAQAAPMLRPYSKSGQIDGLSVGLMGGAAYENLAPRLPTLATKYWNSFSALLLLAVFLLLAGALISGGVSAIARRKSRGEE